METECNHCSLEKLRERYDDVAVLLKDSRGERNDLRLH